MSELVEGLRRHAMMMLQREEHVAWRGADRIEVLEREMESFRKVASVAGTVMQTNLQRIEVLERENARLRRCLGFFASVIKFGEAWSETTEREYRWALGEQPKS